MRILHVSPYFSGAWAYGGIPRAAGATVAGLAARGHHVTVCTTDACDAATRLPTREDGASPAAIDVRIFANVSNRAAYHFQFFTPRHFRRYLREHAAAFDLGHIHGCHHALGAFASRNLRRAGVPYVLTPHGTAPYLEHRRTAKRLFDWTIGRGVVSGAARVVAVSQAERRQLLDLAIPESKISVVPNALDMSEFDGVPRGDFRRRFSIPEGERIVLFLGKLTAQKRLDVVVRAFAALAHPRVRLVIAGNDMGYGRTLAALISQAGIADRTTVTGLLPGRERAAALADADVVVYPSQGEVFGLVPVEALLCGTPVIVSNDSGCGEVIADLGGGLLVPPGDHGALASAITRVLDDRPGWTTAAADARVRARRYSSEQVSAALEALYLDIRASAHPSHLRPAV